MSVGVYLAFEDDGRQAPRPFCRINDAKLTKNLVDGMLNRLLKGDARPAPTPKTTPSRKSN